MLYIEVTRSVFIDAFREAGRENQFSYRGLCALYDYFNDMDSAEMVELDVISICCEFSEYADIDEFRENYGNEYETIDDIERETTVIMIDEDSFIIQDF